MLYFCVVHAVHINVNVLYSIRISVNFETPKQRHAFVPVILPVCVSIIVTKIVDKFKWNYETGLPLGQGKGQNKDLPSEIKQVGCRTFSGFV